MLTVPAAFNKWFRSVRCSATIFSIASRTFPVLVLILLMVFYLCYEYLLWFTVINIYFFLYGPFLIMQILVFSFKIGIYLLLFHFEQW